MNTLNHMTMEACVVDKAGQGYINEATTLYVTSRVSAGYEGVSNIVSAEEWDKAGRPTLVSPQSLYGVTGLVITQEQGEPSPVFLVKCDKWNPAQSTDISSTSIDSVPQTEGFSIVERVSLRKDKGDWVISKIERLQETALPTPKAVAKQTATDSSGNPLPGATQ
jgi:hypothetical protein